MGKGPCYLLKLFIKDLYDFESMTSGMVKSSSADCLRMEYCAAGTDEASLLYWLCRGFFIL